MYPQIKFPLTGFPQTPMAIPSYQHRENVTESKTDGMDNSPIQLWLKCLACENFTKAYSHVNTLLALFHGILEGDRAGGDPETSALLPDCKPSSVVVLSPSPFPRSRCASLFSCP